ncbi:hypothetical protein [Phaeodactylibacter sp.]|uniref:hypothetical protein n=1 Tax=Phaeodactylibacter sp. TaxID=1940289 RepID=UPI0025D99196|nr:hypothetical protein [Phaeodactylibacter sp.]MCI4651423.1 hypothetical protein [Phaeodactylibacter sp.]MCI5092866.1 hypothetical protein [Phaeodactylibacter sp.]
MSRLSVILTVTAFLASSCGEDNRNRIAVENMIQEEVTQRVATYRENRTQRCYEDAVKEASTLADSILLLQARLNRDTASKPPRPTRPERPAAKKLRDSLLKVAPLLSEDSILKLLRLDSLQRDSLQPDTIETPLNQ